MAVAVFHSALEDVSTRPARAAALCCPA